MVLAHSANPGRHRLSDRGADLYETPPEAVRALLAVEKIPSGAIWEPACGPGAIVRVLRAAGHEVYATDLVDYDSPDQDQSGIDFLLEYGSAPYFIGAIITNPPFKLADQFVRHALALCPHVYMLLRLAFLESKRRSAILESGWLKRVYVFRERLPMMHRAGWNGPRASISIPFAWFVFDRGHRGPIELRRISWRRTATCLSDQGADQEASHPRCAGERRKVMALGKRKTTGGNDYLPMLKFDARVGTFYLQDRVHENGKWQTEQRNITDDFRAVFDLENLKRGWIKFSQGAAPDMVMVGVGEDPGDAPSEDHKEGIRLIVKMDGMLGGGVREFLSTSLAVWNSISELHDKYLAGVAEHPFELPVVDLVESRKSEKSYTPVFQITSWVPRPDELPFDGIPPGKLSTWREPKFSFAS